MTRFATLKFGLVVVAVVVWGYGARTDNAHLRLAGMIVLAVAVALRFLPASWRDRIDGNGPSTSPGPGPTDTHL